MNFTEEQRDLIKRTICRGATDDELAMFLATAARLGLDPIAKQIYAVKRQDYKLQREVMTIQTGIDGYRLIADRTGTYAPGPEPTFAYDAQGKLVSATASVKKLTRDGTWHIVSSTAFYDEYVQSTKDGRPMGMWAKMGRTMLAKCAEALALRKANPADLSGIYTKEEMSQAEVVDVTHAVVSDVKPLYINSDQAREVETLISECEPEKQEKIWKFLNSKCGGNLLKFPRECYDNTKRVILERRAEYMASQTQKPTSMDEVVDEVS